MAIKSSRLNSDTRRLRFERLEPKHLLAITLPGDFNGDHIVDADDVTVWQDAYGGSSPSLKAGDADGDGDVDGRDFLMWQRNFGKSERAFENLDRGVVATRASGNNVFVSWRLFAHDPAGVGFNVYRSANGGTPVKLNVSPLTNGTNISDSSANLSQSNSYFVRAVIDSVEQEDSGAFTLAANSPTGSYYTVPMRNIGDYDLRHVSIGDLDGDGAYDYVVARRPPHVAEVGVASQLIEAYKSDGTFLWVVDLGPNSLDVDNIEPGSTTVDVGNWDGIQVYDMDGDGKAEVMFRTANGVVFGDGATLTHANNNIQFMSVVNGLTGVERSRIQVPTDFLADGPMAAMTGIGYLDGVHPSLVVKMKNRVGSGPFNMMILAYDFDGTTITQKWKWVRDIPVSDGHNIRIVDVDGDGKDEVVDIGFALNGDGTLKYELASQGIVHGDRFHIGDFDPARPGLEGYGVQQNNPSMLMEYYYDAATGEILYTSYGTSVGDNGRGDVGDIDPNYPGAEYWSFLGLHNNFDSEHTQIASAAPWPHIQIQWDGDLLSERLSTDSAVVDQWNPTTQTTSRVTTLWNQGSGAITQDGYPIWFGDLIGDWREEVIYERNDRQALVIFTTQINTNTRLYSLAQNPLYRNNMTLKGYLQSRHVDYFLGHGMADPPTPNIGFTPTVDDGNDAPTVAAPAAATVITGATTSLSVLGADDGGEENLTYTWWANGGTAPVTFSENVSNDAKNTMATFNGAGTYSIFVTIRDVAGKTTTSQVTVTVNQTLTSVAVTPPGTVIVPGATQQFAAIAYDQFGRPMTSQPNFTWTVISGAGSINAAGFYTAPAVAGSATVRAAVGAISDTASVTISSDTSLRGWWKMDESGGNVVSDFSGFANHGTAVNGPTFVAGMSGNAMSFDGSNDYVQLPNSIANSAAGSVSMWIRTNTNFTNFAHLFYLSPVASGDGFGAEQELHVSFRADERLHFYIKDAANGVNDINIISPASYANNAWHHIVATWDINGNAVLYANGVQVASAVHDAASFSGSSVVRLGRPGANTRYYSGLMDDVRLYNVAISALQVQELYNQGGSANPPLLLAPLDGNAFLSLPLIGVQDNTKSSLLPMCSLPPEQASKDDSFSRYPTALDSRYFNHPAWPEDIAWVSKSNSDFTVYEIDEVFAELELDLD